MHRISPNRNKKLFDALDQDKLEPKLSELWDKFHAPANEPIERLTAFRDYLKLQLEHNQMFYEVSGGNYIKDICKTFNFLHSEAATLYSEISSMHSNIPELPDTKISALSGLGVLLTWTEKVLQAWNFKHNNSLGGVNLEVDKTSKKARMSKVEAEVKLRELLPELAKKMPPQKITVRFLGKRLGCSSGLISECRPWKSFKKCRDVNKQTTSSKAVPFNQMHLKNVAAKEQSPEDIAIRNEEIAAEMNMLIAEQNRDMQNEDGRNMAYPDR